MKFLNQIVLFLFVSLIVVSCSEKKESTQEVIRPVRTLTVGNTSGSNINTFTGVASAGNEIELSFRSTGLLTFLNLKPGMRVKKGQLLAQLDNVQAKLGYEKAQSGLNSSLSAMNTAKSSLERSKILYEKGSYSLSDYESAKNSFQSALDSYESAKRNLDIEKDKLAYGSIYAPKNGIIASKNVNINETVSSGQVIGVLNAGKDLNINVGLPGGLINQVAIGSSPSISFSAIPNEKFLGNVIEISPILNPEQSTFPVKIEIIEPSNKIKPGMIAQVIFDFSTSTAPTSNLLTLPVKCVGEDGTGNFVFVIETEDEKIGFAKKQPITIGKLTNEGFEITKGLNKGDIIATAGLQTLLDGQKVRLQ